jgi:peptidyl-prolyl cis-trans isomerase SurA
LEAKYPEFKNLVTEYHEGMILYEINSAEVWMKAVQDTVGLRAYYEEIKNNYPISEQDPTPQAFEDIKATIINEYQNYLEKNWLERLRAKYPVIVDEKVFSSILKK